MGTDGGLSAFAAVHNGVSEPAYLSPSPSPPTTPTDSSEGFSLPNENPCSASSDGPSIIHRAPKSAIEAGGESVIVRLEKGEVSSVHLLGPPSMLMSSDYPCGRHILPMGQTWRGEYWGASLRASSTLHQVFVPVIHAITPITAVSRWAELELSTSECGLRYLGDVSRHFSGIWEPSPIKSIPSFHVLGYHSDNSQVSKELTHLELGPWLPTIQQLLIRKAPLVPKILVVGAKGNGKSTLCRVLINTMLTLKSSETGGSEEIRNGVLFLDLDPGQPELAPPGIIYLAHVYVPLLGPSFANVIVPGMRDRKMVRMHYIGANTPQEFPTHYQRCVSDLLSLIRDYDRMPLVINTCGWNSASYQTMLSSTFRGNLLTNIIQLGHYRTLASQGLLQLDARSEEKPFALIPSQPNKPGRRPGRELREMQLQSYMHASGSVEGGVVWDQLPVTTLPNAMTVSSEFAPELFIIIMLDAGVAADHLVDALNGSVAAIVVIKHASTLHGLSVGIMEDRVDVGEGMRIRHTHDGHLPYLDCGTDAAEALDPGTSECIGLGLVTMSDAGSRRLQIKSPLSEGQIYAEVEKGHRIGLVIGRQQGLWAKMEGVLARRSGRTDCDSGK